MFTSTRHPQKPLVDLTTTATTTADSPNAVDRFMTTFLMDLDDVELRKRVGEFLRYRKSRWASLNLARAAKARGDHDGMLFHVRAARSQHRVVLRRLRTFRLLYRRARERQG